MAIGEVTTARHQPTGSLIYGAGMGLVFIGQRVLSSGALAWALTAVGATAVLGALIARSVSARRAAAGDQTGQRALLLLFALGSAALLAYLLTSDLLMVLWGTSLQRHLPWLNTALVTLWPALCLIGTLPVLFVELSYASMRRAPVFERGRLTTALMSGLGVAFALVFAFAAVYSGRISDIRLDVSFFRTTKAGESTSRIVQALDQPLTITTFFPPTNDVGAEVDRYFGSLKGLSPFFSLQRYDHALDPGKGRDLGVTGNGVIVFTRGTLRRQIGLPLTIERAREDLRKLDAQVNSTLMNITRPSRRIYFTQGHGERVFEPVDETDRRSTLSHLKQSLSDQGYDVLELSIAHGLGTDIPDDAEAVLAVGPTRAFLPEESATLLRFVKQRGGSLLLALDPEAKQSHTELLEPLGVSFDPTILVNDMAHWRRSGHASDRSNVATVAFGGHVSVATLAKLGFQAPVVFMGAGALHLQQSPSDEHGAPKTEVIVQADANTWADVDLNFEAGANETRQAFALATSVSFDLPAPLPQGRVLVFGDADVFADIAMQNNGNQTLFADALHWLARDEAIAGQISSEEDVPIAHSRQKDVAWFYITSFIPPLVILALGFLFTRSRRVERARDEHAAPKPAALIAPEAAKEAI